MSENTGQLAAALAKAQGEFPTIEKTSEANIPMKSGGSFKYCYADLAEILKTVTPTLSKFELAIHQTTTYTKESGLLLKTMLLHSSGEKLSGDYPLAIHEDARKMGAELTYARRYTITAMLGVQADDFDDEGAVQSTANRNVMHEIQKDVIATVKAAKPPEKVIKNYAPSARPDGDFTIRFGKHTGRTLNDLGTLEAGKYVEWLTQEAEKKNKPLEGQVLEFVQAYQRFASSPQKT